jgi:uncharacterized membrane protein
MKIKNKLIFDYLKLKNTIKVTFFLSLFYFFTLFLRNKVNLEIFILLTILFSINFLLFYIYFSFKKELNYFPIYPLIIFYYFATCSAYFYLNYKLEPIFLLNMTDTEWNERYIYPEIKQIIFVLSLGLAFFSFGYFFLNYFVIKKKINNLKLEWNDKTEYTLVLVFLLFIIFYYIDFDKKFINLSIISQLKFPIMFFLLAYFQIKYLTSKNIFFYVILILLLSFLFVLEVSSGFTVTAYLLITIVIAIKFFITKKINLLIIFLIIASALLTNTFKYEIRDKTWDYIGQNQLKKDNQNNQLLKNLNETKEIYLNSNPKNIFDKNNLMGQEYRLFHSNISLQITLARTPSQIEYYEGKSYAGILYKFIPSFLIKNKPIEEWGNFWGHRYSVLNPNDYQTSWNYPVLNEFYANFSIKGVVLGMFFLGFIIKVLLIFFSFNFKQPVLLSMSSAIMLNFFFLENNLSLIIGSVINQILFFSIIIFLMCLHNFLLKQISNLK